MTKKNTNPLQAALNSVDSKNEEESKVEFVEPKSETTKRIAHDNTRLDRANKVLIAGHFPKKMRQQLRIIAAEDDVTIQELLSEAINLLFVKKGKKSIKL